MTESSSAKTRDEPGIGAGRAKLKRLLRRHCLVLPLATVLLVWLASASFLLGSERAILKANQQLEKVQHYTNIAVRAFVKDSQMRLYFTSQKECTLFKAEWKLPRVAVEEFSYASATFQSGKTTTSMKPPSAHWLEIKVVDRTQSERLLRAASRRIVPNKPQHGIYCQYALGDVVVYRGEQGEIKIAQSTNTPAGLQIDQRYTRQELVSTAAKTLQSDLQSAYPGHGKFLLVIGEGRNQRWAFIDLNKRQAVILYVPMPGEKPNDDARLGMGLSHLVSFILVDHVWAFIKNPVSSSGRTVHQFLEWPATLLEPRLRDFGTNIPPLKNSAGMDLTAWEKWLDAHTGTRTELGSVRLLIDGDQFYNVLEHRITGARSNINIHVCIFDSDDVAVDMADLLKQRSTNIDVKIIFDRLNSRGASMSPPATPMREGFTPPNPISSYLRSGGNIHVRPQPNPGFSCDHSKVFLIDGRYVFLGGMNLGREYRYEWHDLMAEVEGPVVASFQKQFDKKWAQLGIWGDCSLAAESLCGGKPKFTGPYGTNWIKLRRLYTRTFDHEIRKAELAAIARASNHVYLENPYLFSRSMIVALARARMRGIDVRVVLPSENDSAMGHKSNLVIANYLRECGVRVFLYPGMTHVKSLMVDGWVCFGSANCDALSLRMLREANLATSDPGFSARFRRELFEADFARSRELMEAVPVDWTDHLVDSFLIAL